MPGWLITINGFKCLLQSCYEVKMLDCWILKVYYLYKKNVAFQFGFQRHHSTESDSS